MDDAALKREAGQIIAECMARDWSLLLAGLAIFGLLKNHGRPPAEGFDPFAWATGGDITTTDAVAFDRERTIAAAAAEAARMRPAAFH